MINVKLNAQTTLIIHDDKSVSLIQDSIHVPTKYDEVALSPTLALKLVSYLNKYITEDK